MFLGNTLTATLRDSDREIVVAPQRRGQLSRLSATAPLHAPSTSQESKKSQESLQVSDKLSVHGNLPHVHNIIERRRQNKSAELDRVQRSRRSGKSYVLAHGVDSRSMNGNGRKQPMWKKILGPATVLITGTSREKHRFLDALARGKQKMSLSQLNEAAVMLCRMHRIQDALALVEVWDQKPLSDVLAEAKPVKTFTIMIDVYGRAKQLTRAFSLFYGMARLGIELNLITYNAMIAACARNNEPDLAHEVYAQMQTSGLVPDKFTYASLIDSCAKSGQVERAFEMSRLMDINQVVKDPTIYSALMDACGRAKQLERAFSVFEEMKRDGVWPNLVTFAVLIGTCANAREPERAFQLFSEIKHWGFPQPNVVVYSALIDACAKAGWPERAELVLQTMIQNGVQPNEISFGALMEGWTKSGRIDLAFAVIDRMVEKYRLNPNAIVVGGLIDACRRLGEFNRVKVIWSIMVKYNIRPSPYYYPCLIAMAAKNGDIDVASAILLHAYARGSLRRVSLNSENPALRALACSIVYLNDAILNTLPSDQEQQKYIGRLRTVFNSTAMVAGQTEHISPDVAYNCCISWGTKAK